MENKSIFIFVSSFCIKNSQIRFVCPSVVEFLMQKLEKKMKIDVFSIVEIDKTELKFYDKIIVGASIRYGKHSPKLFKFI